MWYVNNPTTHNVKAINVQLLDKYDKVGGYRCRWIENVLK